MGAEIKTKGAKVETWLSESLHKRFKSKAKKNATSMSQVIRDLVQKYVKG